MKKPAKKMKGYYPGGMVKGPASKGGGGHGGKAGTHKPGTKSKKLAGMAKGGKVASAGQPGARKTPRMKTGVAAGPAGKVGVGARGRGATNTSGAR